MFVLIAYLAFFFFLIVILKKERNPYKMISLPFWVAIAYSFLLFAHIISPYHYTTIRWWMILPYVAICMIALIGGYHQGIKKPLKILRNIGGVRINTLFYLSLVGACILTFDFLRNNTVTLGMRVEDQNLSGVGVIGASLCHLSIIVWLADLYKYERYSEKLKVRSILAPVCYVAFTILSGGRQAILLLLLSSGITVLYAVKYRRVIDGTRPKRIIPIIFYVFVAVIGVYFSTVSLLRSQISDIDNKMDMFEGSTTVMDKSFRDFNRDFFAADFFCEFAYYYAHEFPKLDILFKYYDYPPTLGFSQLHYIERRFQWLWGDWVEKSWDAVVDASEKKANFSSHTWGTFLSNYIIDYGRLGTIFMCFITGLVCASCYSRRKFDNLSYIARQVWISSGIIFSIQFSPFSELCWFVPLIVTSFFNIHD